MRHTRAAFTLMELMVVLVILVILAAIVVPLVSNSVDDAKVTTTRASMTALRDAVLAYHHDMKGLEVAGVSQRSGMPSSLLDLQQRPKDASGIDVPLFDPATRRGWRGPYINQATGRFDLVNLHPSFIGHGAQDAPAFVDGWGNPIVLQWPTTASLSVEEKARYVRLVSAGAPLSLSGKLLSSLDTLATELMPSRPTATNSSLPDQRGNDLVLFILTQDLYP